MRFCGDLHFFHVLAEYYSEGFGTEVAHIGHGHEPQAELNFGFVHQVVHETCVAERAVAGAECLCDIFVYKVFGFFGEGNFFLFGRRIRQFGLSSCGR
jgi:hypothetical protein